MLAYSLQYERGSAKASAGNFA